MNIVIVDYGMGNLRSVQKGFETVGVPAVVSDDPHVVEQADKIVLPGVGAFPDAMAGLSARGLIEPIKQAISAEKPFLGICLGLQLLFDVGEEGGPCPGLGILRGRVVRFHLNNGYKVPHMGWNELVIKRPAPALQGLSSGVHMYFVHSYYVVPEDPSVIAVEANYPTPFTAAVWQGRLFATQFHPEKSQRNGLQILENFAKLS